MNTKMLTAIAAVGCAFALNADVTSQNIVGYVAGPKSVDQYNFISIGFSTVGYNTCDIQQIKIADGDAGTVGWGAETFSIWAGGPDVVEGSDNFIYYDPSMDPDQEATDFYWGDGDCIKQNYPIAAGQAFVVQMGAADLDVTITPPFTLK